MSYLFAILTRFERGKYRYVFRNQCEEIPGLSVQDGNITIFLSTHGTNAEEVPKELVKFLEYGGSFYAVRINVTG